MKAPAKIIFGGLLYSLTLTVLLIALGFWLMSKQFHAPGPLPETATIEIPRGSSLFSIAQNLKNNNV
ncbi:MAG: hypothetical protein ACT4OY_00055, partial [Alphaproteobacteria bacterium]